MKNKSLLLLVVLSIVFALAVAGCGPKGPDDPGNGDPDKGETPKTFRLQFATFWPAGDFQVKQGHEVWAKEIADRVARETPHTIEFSIQPGGVLLGPLEIFQGVADGAADLGTTCPNYTMGIFPLTVGLELPGYNNDNALVASVTMHEAWKMSPELQKEYEDVEVMFFWATGPGDFITNRPVRTLEDLSGQQIRAAGATGLTIAALGATPVSMPMSESYGALQSGVVEGILGPTDILTGFKLAEVTKYITKTPFAYNIIFVKVMNKDTWNSFPPSVQKIFKEVNEKYVVEYGKLRTNNTVLGQQDAVKNFGHEVFQLDPAEEARWIEKTQAVPDKWVKDTEVAGLPGKTIYQLFKELDAKYSAMHGSYGK